MPLEACHARGNVGSGFQGDGDLTNGKNDETMETLVENLRLNLLGGFEVHIAGELTPLAKKARALLAYLALADARPQSRTKTASLLWADSSESQSRASLRQALMQIRRALGARADDVLRTDSESIHLIRDRMRVDVIDFESLATTEDPTSVRGAMERYRGDFLDGFHIDSPPFEHWLVGERERLRALAIQCLMRLIDTFQQARENDRAIVATNRLLSLDPLREDVHRTLMSLYRSQGRTSLALKQYRRCRDALQHELGISTEPQTDALFRDILRGRRTASDSPRQRRASDLSHFVHTLRAGFPLERRKANSDSVPTAA